MFSGAGSGRPKSLLPRSISCAGNGSDTRSETSLSGSVCKSPCSAAGNSTSIPACGSQLTITSRATHILPHSNMASSESATPVETAALTVLCPWTAGQKQCAISESSQETGTAGSLSPAAPAPHSNAKTITVTAPGSSPHTVTIQGNPASIPLSAATPGKAPGGTATTTVTV